MMKYEFQKNNIDKYMIIELDTKQMIKNNLSFKEARNRCNSLNRGGGFYGFTPNFFLDENT